MNQLGNIDIFNFVDTSGNNPDPNLYGACDKVGILYKLKPRQCVSCLLMFTPEKNTQEKCEGCMSKVGETIKCSREGCENEFELTHGRQRFCKDPVCKEKRIDTAVKKVSKEPKKTIESPKKRSSPLVDQKDIEKEELIIHRAFEVLEGITDVKEVVIKTYSGLSISIINQ